MMGPKDQYCLQPTRDAGGDRGSMRLLNRVTGLLIQHL